MALVKIYKQANGGGALSTLDIGITPITGGSVGGVLFEGTGNLLEESSKFIWDVVNGRLGIGTNTPLGILHLKETAQTTRFLMDGDAGQSKIITFRTSGLQRFGLYVNNIAESGSNAGSDFAIRAYSDLGVLLSTPFYIKRSSGNVLINSTTDEGYKLDVVGNDGRINTLTIGLGGGQVASNTALGLSALNKNTTGSDNTAIGALTLYDNTTGAANTAVGYYALQKNSTSSNNTALGYASLLSNVTASNHTAVGTSSLRNITSGSYTTAFGVNAGRYIADGVTNATTLNTSVFIGALTKPLANSQSNQIVIGYDAIGLGSNSVVLGNSSITLTALRGNVLIGTTTDAGYKLDVNGSVRATGSISATSLLARGTYLNQTLVATANNDVLVALDIAPTFTTGAFTGVQSIALRLPNGGRITNASSGNSYNVYVATNETTLNSPSSTGTVGFQLNSGFVGRFMGTTGNLLLQNGGTFTDEGYKLDVNGSVRATGSISATSLLARGTYLNQTLVATANNDVLVGLDIAPTFTTGAFTGITSFGIRVTGAVRSSSDIQAANGNASLSANNLSFNNTSTTARVLASSTTTNLAFRIGSTDYAQFFNTTGNLLLQNGGTFTDVASSRLTINSTTQGFLPPRMTTTQKNAIASPATGLVVYDNTLNNLNFYNGNTWTNGNGVHSIVPLASGDVTWNGITASTTSILQTANTIRVSPYIPAQSITTSNLYIEVSTATAGSLCRIVIYSDVDGVPTNLLYVSADLDCSTTGLKTAITSFSFVVGTRYWLGIQTNNNNSTRVGLGTASSIPLGQTFITYQQASVVYASPTPNPISAVLSTSTCTIVYITKA